MLPLPVADHDLPGLEEACGLDPGLACETVFDLTHHEAAAKAVEFLLARPLRIALIFLVAWVAHRVVRRTVRVFASQFVDPDSRARFQRMKKRTGMDRLHTGEVNLRGEARAHTIVNVLRSLSGAVIYTFAALVALGELNINIGPLIAGAGIVGVALGFGAQALVKDFLSGISMLIEDQFGVGDVIDVGEASGVVEAFSLRTTRLRDVEGTVWHVPNGEIRRVGNKSQEWARALVDIDVAYDTDIERAQEVIAEVAGALSGDDDYADDLLEDPEVWGVETLGADGISIRLVIKTKPGTQFAVSRALRRRIKDRFDTEGIEIPFPQRTLWVRREGDATGLPGTD